MAANSLRGLPRSLYRRARSLPEAREERRFRARLRADPAAPELVVSPHLDDAVLDCWSVLSSGREVQVVNVFAGVPENVGLTSWDAITGAADSAERARERIAEDAVALARAPREPFNLDLLDAQYRTGPLDRMGLSGPSLEQIDLAVISRLPSASRVYAPAGIGGHGDHVRARRYGQMLSRAGMPVTLYAELPYCVAYGWPSWVDGREPEPNRNVDAYWNSSLEGLPEMPPLRSAQVVRLDDVAAADKLEAMKCYRTQYPCLNYGGRGLLDDPEIHRFEVHWMLGSPGAA